MTGVQTCALPIQRSDFWAVRERIPEANRLIGAVSNHDISLPLYAVPEFIRRGPEVIAKIGRSEERRVGKRGRTTTAPPH